MSHPSRRSLLHGLSAAGLSASFGAAAEPVAEIAAAKTGRAPFRRGIGIGHCMGWADVGANGQFNFPPFAGEGREFHASAMQALRRAGFDFVRLAVDPGPFLQFTGTQRAWMDHRLLQTTRSILNAGLGVVVDFHPSNLQPDYLSAKLTRGVRDKTFQAYLALLTWAAAQLGRLERRSPAFALELMNEPEVSPRVWQPMLEAAYKAARSGSPDLPLVLGGGEQNSVEACLALDTGVFERDRALIYTFHDYEPWQFTHQGAEGNPAFYLTDVPYPASGPMQAVVAATNERIGRSGLGAREKAAEQKAAQGRIEAYYRTAYDRRTREARYDRIADWATRRGIPKEAILLGEFGVHRTPYQAGAEGSASRDRWLAETRQAAERHGFGWSAWVHTGAGGFALAENETGPELDRSVAKDLGLGR